MPPLALERQALQQQQHRQHLCSPAHHAAVAPDHQRHRHVVGGGLARVRHHVQGEAQAALVHRQVLAKDGFQRQQLLPCLLLGQLRGRAPLLATPLLLLALAHGCGWRGEHGCQVPPVVGRRRRRRRKRERRGRRLRGSADVGRAPTCCWVFSLAVTAVAGSRAEQRLQDGAGRSCGSVCALGDRSTGTSDRRLSTRVAARLARCSPGAAHNHSTARAQHGGS